MNRHNNNLFRCVFNPSRTALLLLLAAMAMMLNNVCHAQEEDLADSSKKPVLARFYAVEMVIFTNDNAAYAQEETWPNPVSLNLPDNLAILVNKPLQDVYPDLDPLRTAATTTGKISYLPLLGAEFSTIQAAVEAIKNSGKHRILLHNQWLQRLDFENAAPHLLIQTDGNTDRLGGTLKIFKTEFINLNTNLWLTSFFGANASSKPWPAPPVAELSNQAGNNFNIGRLNNAQNIKRIVLLKNQRGITADKLTYIDHPLFGVLIKISPYNPPTP